MNGIACGIRKTRRTEQESVNGCRTASSVKEVSGRFCFSQRLKRKQIPDREDEDRGKQKAEEAKASAVLSVTMIRRKPGIPVRTGMSAGSRTQAPILNLPCITGKEGG